MVSEVNAPGSGGGPASPMRYAETHTSGRIERIAVFYTKLYSRLLGPLTAADQPQAPPDLRAALATLTHHVDDDATRARLPPGPRET
jgi:hypothetical protein